MSEFTLDLINILLLVSACYSCFIWGKTTSAESVLRVLLKNKIITKADLKKITDLTQKDL